MLWSSFHRKDEEIEEKEVTRLKKYEAYILRINSLSTIPSLIKRITPKLRKWGILDFWQKWDPPKQPKIEKSEDYLLKISYLDFNLN